MIETLFAFMLFASVSVALIQGLVIVKRGMNAESLEYQKEIERIEYELDALFLPVEDVEWALSWVLP